MSDHVHKHIKLTGSSTQSMEAAVSNAIAKASRSVRDMRWFEVAETRGHITDGAIAHRQVTVKAAFTLD